MAFARGMRVSPDVRTPPFDVDQTARKVRENRKVIHGCSSLMVWPMHTDHAVSSREEQPPDHRA